MSMKRWRFFAVFWPLSCMVFAAFIVYQAVGGMEERAFDISFEIIPLIFFASGMSIRRRLLKERESATVLTTATVVSRGYRRRSGHRSYFPEYAFKAGETEYHVKSPAGYGFCHVSEGRRVELYYSPGNPKVFYVPLMQKHDNRLSILLCGIGVVYPLLGLFAPLLREAFSFLE